jgi:hypothetical protein
MECYPGKASSLQAATCEDCGSGFVCPAGTDAATLVQSTTETTGSLELSGITSENFEDAKEDILQAIRKGFYDDYGSWPLSIELSSSGRRRQLDGAFTLTYRVLMPSEITPPATIMPLASDETNRSNSTVLSSGPLLGLSPTPFVITLSPEMVNTLVTSAMRTAVAKSMNISTDLISFTTVGNLTSSEEESTAGQCPAGRYSAAGGAGECLACAPGKFSSRGARECASCPGGYFEPEGSNEGGAASQCQYCPPGKFQNSKGKVYCEEVWSNHLLVMTTTQVYEQRLCPRVGVSCDNNTKRYSGTHWHGE